MENVKVAPRITAPLVVLREPQPVLTKGTNYWGVVDGSNRLHVQLDYLNPGEVKPVLH